MHWAGGLSYAPAGASEAGAGIDPCAREFPASKFRAGFRSASDPAKFDAVAARSVMGITCALQAVKMA